MYALWCQLPRTRRIKVGSLGPQRFEAGLYCYVGSALGPGGVRARLNHHLRRAAKPHWHIDYLRRYAKVETVWSAYSPENLEHHWAAAMTKLGGLCPVPRFGSSDCACPSHLFYFGG